MGAAHMLLIYMNEVGHQYDYPHYCFRRPTLHLRTPFVAQHEVEFRDV